MLGYREYRFLHERPLHSCTYLFGYCNRTGGCVPENAHANVHIIYVLFSARCNIYISRLCYDVSVRLSVHLSVTFVHCGHRVQWITDTFGPIFTIFAPYARYWIADDQSSLLFSDILRDIAIMPWLQTNKSATTQNWLPWQRPLRYWKKRSRSIICTQNTFIR